MHDLMAEAIMLKFVWGKNRRVFQGLFTTGPQTSYGPLFVPSSIEINKSKFLLLFAFLKIEKISGYFILEKKKTTSSVIYLFFWRFGLILMLVA